MRFRRRLPAAALLGLVMALPGAALAAPGDAGPTASASVEISVSVATRYGLATASHASKALGTGQPDRGGFCFTTNGAGPALPVMMIWPASGRAGGNATPAAERAVQLPPCARGERQPGPVDRIDAPAGAGQVVIRPE